LHRSHLVPWRLPSPFSSTKKHSTPSKKEQWLVTQRLSLLLHAKRSAPLPPFKKRWEEWTPEVLEDRSVSLPFCSLFFPSWVKKRPFCFSFFTPSSFSAPLSCCSAWIPAFAFIFRRKRKKPKRDR
jgi:hypothetical protein